MTDHDWQRVRMMLGIPAGWRLRSRTRSDGWSIITAEGKDPLPCGHRTMQVTTKLVPVGVALMAARYRFHTKYCR